VNAEQLVGCSRSDGKRICAADRSWLGSCARDQRSCRQAARRRLDGAVIEPGDESAWNEGRDYLRPAPRPWRVEIRG